MSLKLLCHAVKEGDVAAAEALVRADSSLAIEADDDGTTALFHAARGGHLDVVLRLLKHDQDVTRMVPSDANALSAAARHGHLDVLRSLLNHRRHDADKTPKQQIASDMELHRFARHSPLCIAAKRGDAAMTRLLLSFGAGESKVATDALCLAAKRNRFCVIRLLLDHGIDPNCRTASGTPLLGASRLGATAAMEALFEYGAEASGVVSAAQHPGGHVRYTTSLILASQNNQLAAVDLLLRHCANVDETEPQLGTSALYVAAQNGNSDVVARLLQGGASVNQASNAGTTPLAIAVHGHHYKVVLRLLEGGAIIGTRALCGGGGNNVRGDNEVSRLLRAVQRRWTTGTSGVLQSMPRFIKDRAMTVVLCLRAHGLPNEIIRLVLSHCRVL